MKVYLKDELFIVILLILSISTTAFLSYSRFGRKQEIVMQKSSQVSVKIHRNQKRPLVVLLKESLKKKESLNLLKSFVY